MKIEDAMLLVVLAGLLIVAVEARK